MLRTAVLSLAALLLAAPARAEEAARPHLDRLAGASSAAERKAAIDALLALDPIPVDELKEVLARKRASSDADRRAILLGQGFDVPDEKGRFRAPGRQTKADEKKNDEFDWLAPLVELPKSPALSDVLVDIASLRALAASERPAAAAVILDFAFRPDGVAYRDECGRSLRRMAPWSLPALIIGAEKPGNNRSLARYAKYQLERLDRESPHKALNAAPTDDLKVEILKAFAESQYREAVFTVLDTVDHVAPEVRRAAREAWMEYTTGKPPPEPPKQKLQLPGGKLTEEEMPLWLDHRQLADIAIRRLLEKLTGQKPDRRAKLADLSKQLFDFYDQRRQKQMDEELEAGLAEARAGKPAEAARRFDAILVQVPDYHRRAEMAEVYLAYGESLEEQQKWREAATAYGKAHAVAGKGPLADSAMAHYHRARGRALEAEGKDGATELAMASELDSAISHAGAAEGGKGWMLYGGLGAAALGLCILVWGVVARRRGQAPPFPQGR